MSTTFSTLYTAALRSAQLSVNNADEVAAAKAAVNEAHMLTCGDGTAWDFTEREGQWTTQAGSDTYTLAGLATALSITGASIREVVYLTDDTDGGRPLPSMSWSQLEELAATSQSSTVDGAPCVWARWGDRLRLWPTPGGVYKIGSLVYLSAAALSGDSDTVLVPDAFAMAVLVPYAAAVLLEQEGGTEALSAANLLRSRHDDALRRMRMAHGAARQPSFNVVSPGAFADVDEDDLLWVAG